MDFQKAIETIKQYLPDYANEHLTHSKGKNQFDCVFCGSGTGVNGTGAFTVITAVIIYRKFRNQFLLIWKMITQTFLSEPINI